MGDGHGELTLLVPHDDDDAFGERSNVVPARTAVEVADPAFLFRQRGVDIAEAIDLERAEETRIHHAAVEIHPHDIEKTAPAGRAIEDPRIGEAYGRVLWPHIGDADFQERRQPGRMRAF